MAGTRVGGSLAEDLPAHFQIVSERSVTFVHPVLGRGGAERLILDCSRALRSAGWKTDFLVSRYDPDSAFEDCGEEEITVVPSRIPERLGGGLQAMCTILRLRNAARVRPGDSSPCIFFTDLVPHIIPRLRRNHPGSRIVHYCHFPDSLLVRRHRSGAYSLYRRVIDRMERHGIHQAHLVLTNSEYTKSNLRHFLPSLHAEQLHVLYPACPPPPQRSNPGERNRFLLMSLGRIHPSKNHSMAIEAYARVQNTFPLARLIIAGGYDARDPECVREQTRLHALAKGIGGKVEVLLNCTAGGLEKLWRKAGMLICAAEGEHFGIAIVEAQARGVPVIAFNRGGPREIIEHGESGLLVEPGAGALARGISDLLNFPDLASRLSIGGPEQYHRKFSPEIFRCHLLEWMMRVLGD